MTDQEPDRYGNVIAWDGYDRCVTCGCAYWEDDVCVWCNQPIDAEALNEIETLY